MAAAAAVVVAVALAGTSSNRALGQNAVARPARSAAGHGRGAAELRGQSTSHVTGDARLSVRRRRHVLVVRVRLKRLAARSRHPMRIESGSCHAPGAVVYDLHDVVANEFGGGRAATHIAGVAGASIDPAWHVTVYKGPTMDGEGAQPISCGPVRLSPGGLVE